jgi:adenine-specific DNA-methyltransferase
MIKDILNLNEETTPNSKEIAILKEHFPSCFKNDGSFDIERFKGFLGDKVSITDEGYELKFLGKNYARLLASVDTTTVIKPNEEHNTKPENKNSENIYISGDNLDGLKHLLKSYSGQIKCIYIDPPYNTGTDGFVYNDKFNFNADSLSEKLSISEEQAKRILDLTKRGSASHSAWLLFMYSRLLLARDLLSENGVIFISIDDNEVYNLKLICDDIFGEENFVEALKWKRKKQPSFLGKHTAKMMEYVLVYANNQESLEKLSIENISDSTKKVINISNNESIRVFNPGVEVKGIEDGVIRAGRYLIRTMEVEYLSDIIVKNSRTVNRVEVSSKFSVSQEKINNFIEEKLLYITAQKGLRRYVSELEKDTRKSITDLLLDEWGDNQESDKQIIELFGKKIFETPKPIELIYNLASSVFSEDTIILDFFSGSATTAHAVMKLNAEDDGNRKYIMVQLPETIEEGKPAYEAGYRTIDQIGMDRIIKAANKIKEENPDTEADLGFKHFILQEPTPNTLDKIENFDPDENKMFADKTLLDEFGKPTILATWLVRDGYGLTAQPEELDLSGYKGYFIDKHLYLIDTEIPNEAIEDIVVKYETDGGFNPENIVLFGYSFTWTQMEQLKVNLKRLKDTEKNLNINFDVRY